MTGGSRTFHHKSRNGCGSCKKRRVRCNLQAPSCSNCTRRGELCDYSLLGLDSSCPPSLSPSHAAYITRRGHNKSGSSSPEAPLAGPGLSFVAPRASHNLPDVDAAPIRAVPRRVVDSMALCLLQDDERGLISDELVGQTDTSEFLEHNMAVVSALHNSTTSQPNNDSGKAASDLAAYQHQIAASSKFRSSVGAISDRNWFTVLVFAISVLIFHFDIHRRAKRGLADDEFLEPILALRGAARLGMELGPWLMKSRLLAVIRRRVAAENPPWDHLAEETVANLQLMNESSSSSLRRRAVCRDALDKMQFWLRLTSCRPRTWLHFVWWPGAIDQEYLQLLEAKDPMALVILVHWCAVMKASPRKWFMEGWAENVARPAIAQLGPEWDDLMEWALSRIRVSGSR